MTEAVLKNYPYYVKNYMQEITRHSLRGTEVGSILDEAISGYGKMFRAKLLLLCGFLGSDWKKKQETLYKLAALVELTHLASLIHDDIIDDSPYRRGKPSVQGKYGKKVAVFAGDFLMARIYYYEVTEGLYEAAAVLTKAVEAMCIGEIGQSVCRFKEDVSEQEYFWNIEGKTATLFEAACYIGAKESGCCEESVRKLSAFGKNLGFMFQLKDDVLDFTSDLKELGKETRKDFQNGIYTFPVIAALKNKEAKKCLSPIMQANRNGNLSEKQIAEMEACINAYGVAETYKEIKRLSCINKELIKGFSENEEVITLFSEILDVLET